MVDLHSPIKMKGKFSRKIVEWRDGKLYGDDGLVQEILSYAKNIEKTGNPVFYQDVSFGHRNLLKTNITAYALACMVDEMELIGGKLPEVDEIFKDEGTPSKTTDGGPGSGNYGHEGRPGMVGGSGKGGGSQYRAGSKEEGYSGLHKSKQFESIHQSATSCGDYHSFVKSLSSEQKELIKKQHKECGSSESLQQYTNRVYTMLRKRNKKPVITRTNRIVEGKDLTSSFHRREKEFPQEIYDVMDQQGFNGRPRVVSRAEFEEIVKDNPEQPLLFRSYTASGKSQLDAYDKQLEGGEWYVDCGTGGAQYGQGMYTAGVYGHADMDEWDWKSRVGDEMIHYRELNEYRIGRDKAPKPSGYTGKKPDMLRSNDNTVYQIGDADTFKPIDEVQAKPGEFYCLRTTEKEDWKNGDYYYVLRANEDGQLGFYYGEDVQFTPAPGEWLKKMDAHVAPIQKLDSTEMLPQSTTRRMTLDKSAKIVDYATIVDEFNAEKHRRLEDAIEKMKPEDITPIVEKEQRQLVGFPDVDKDVVRTLEERLVQSGNDNALANALSVGGDGVKSRFNPSLRFNSAQYGIGKLIAEGVKDDPDSQYKAFFDWASKQPEFSREVKRIRDGIHDRVQENWKDEARLHLQRQTFGLPKDVGSYAALRGYDAINAKGHGETGSYTVVLNRTKLIIDELPWEVF